MSKEHGFTLSRRDFLIIGGSAAVGIVGGYIVGRSQPQATELVTKSQPQILEILPLVESGFEEKALQKLKRRFLQLDQKIRKSNDPQKFPSWANQETGEYVSNSPNWSDALFVGALDLFSDENPDFFNPLVKFYTDLLVKDGGAYKKLLEEDTSPDVAWTSFLTLVPSFEKTKEQNYKTLALEAADFVIDSLYDEGLELFSTSKNSGQYVVNSVLTVTPLLFWAEKNEEDKTKAKKYGYIARKYIESAIKAFMRPDGSVFHAITKTEKGLIKGETKNPTGYSNDLSISTRVLSAFIFGLANAYGKNPQRTDFLEAALKSMTFAIKNTPKNASLPFDIGQIPQELKKYKDTAGQSALACAALYLAELINDSSVKTYLTNYGRFLVKDVVDSHITTYGGVANAIQGYWAIRDFKEGKTKTPVQIETINGNYWLIKTLKKSKDLD